MEDGALGQKSRSNWLPFFIYFLVQFLVFVRGREGRGWEDVVEFEANNTNYFIKGFCDHKLV